MATVFRSLAFGIAGDARFTAEIGVDARTYEDNFGKIDSYDDKTSIWPIGKIAFDYALHEDLGVVQVNFASMVEDSTSSNSVRILNANIIGSHSFYPDSLGSLCVPSWFGRKDMARPQACHDCGNDTFAIQGGATYEFRRGMAVRLRGSFRDRATPTSAPLITTAEVWATS